MCNNKNKAVIGTEDSALSANPSFDAHVRSLTAIKLFFPKTDDVRVRKHYILFSNCGIEESASSFIKNDFLVRDKAHKL